MRFTFVLLALLLAPVSGFSQPSTVVSDADRLTALRSREAELEEQYAATAAELAELRESIRQLEGGQAASASDLVRVSFHIAENLHAEPTDGSEIVGQVPARKDAVLDAGLGLVWWRVTFDGIVGWVKSTGFRNVDDPERLEAIKQAGERAALEQAKEKIDVDRAERRAELAERFGDEVASKILRDRYWVGMSHLVAVASLGMPDAINRTVTSTIQSQQWVYRERDLYLYFENGMLVSFQD